jgi:hypothetical protein
VYPRMATSQSSFSSAGESHEAVYEPSSVVGGIPAPSISASASVLSVSQMRSVSKSKLAQLIGGGKKAPGGSVGLEEKVRPVAPLGEGGVNVPSRRMRR